MQGADSRHNGIALLRANNSSNLRTTMAWQHEPHDNPLKLMSRNPHGRYVACRAHSRDALCGRRRVLGPAEARLWRHAGGNRRWGSPSNRPTGSGARDSPTLEPRADSHVSAATEAPAPWAGEVPGRTSTLTRHAWTASLDMSAKTTRTERHARGVESDGLSVPHRRCTTTPTRVRLLLRPSIIQSTERHHARHRRHQSPAQLLRKSPATPEYLRSATRLCSHCRQTLEFRTHLSCKSS